VRRPNADREPDALRIAPDPTVDRRRRRDRDVTGSSTATATATDVTGSSTAIGPAWIVLAVATAGNFGQLGARLLVSPVVPFVLVAFDATRSTVGLALGGMWAVYALAQFPSGVLGDRYGERRLLLAALAGTAVAALALGAAPTLAAFVAVALALGAAAGLFFAPATSLLSRLYGDGEGRGGALGTLTAGGAVAGAAFPAVGGLVAASYGWRPALAVGGLVAVPLAAVAFVAVPRVEPVAPGRRLREAVDPGRIRAILTRPGVAYTVAVAVAGGYTFQAFSSFFPTFLVQYRGVEPGAAGVALGVGFALSAVAQTVAGRLSDAVGRDAAIAASFVLAGTGVTTLLAVPGTVGLVAGTVVLGVGIAWPGVVQARVMDQLSDAERGVGFGLARTVYMFVAAAGSVLTGVLADVGGWPLAYGAVLVVLGAALALLGANRALKLGL
jgi:MFS family permease